MASKKQEILQRVLDEIEPGKWNVAKPQDSDDPDTECILRRKADHREVKLAIDNSRFRSNNIDDIKKLVESAINFPRLRQAPSAAIGKRKCPECQKLRRAKREWITQKIYFLVLAPLAFVSAFAILLPIAVVGGFMIFIWTRFTEYWTHFTTDDLRSPRAKPKSILRELEKGQTTR